MDKQLPPEIRQFIAQQIDSLAQLEALLLLRRESQRFWSASELSRTLYLSDEMCRGMFEDLERRKFVCRDPESDRFRYDCSNVQADSLLAMLAELYLERRVAVISEIYSNPVAKVQTFADAFRMRKDDPS